MEEATRYAYSKSERSFEGQAKAVMLLHNKITNLVKTVIPERIAEERRICKEQQVMARSEWDGIPPHSPYEDAIAADSDNEMVGSPSDGDGDQDTNDSDSDSDSSIDSDSSTDSGSEDDEDAPDD